MNSVEMGLQLLGPEECDILKLLYPKFSNEEIQNRRSKLLAEMEKQKIDALLVAEFLFTGSAAHWITNWPATTATIVLLVPDQPVHVIVEHYNHLPHAQKMVTDAEVIWGKRIPLDVAQQTIKKLKQSVHRLGVIGRLSPDEQETIAVGVEEIVDFNSTYRKIRLVKSEEELHWIRIGALFSDMALDAMVSSLELGMTERELSAKTQAAYLPHGGAHVIEFMGVTSMKDPDCCVPPQFPSTRKLMEGDVLVTEITSHFWNYPGQVLRTMTIHSEPTALYQELHAMAEEVLETVEKALRPGRTAEEIFQLTSVIEESGFTIWDDLIHGYGGGGYLAPVIGCTNRPAGPTPDFIFEEDMTVVVQPNIITLDEKAGVQTGGMVRITGNGVESLQRYPKGLIQV